MPTRIPISTRASIRLFAFSIGNGTVRPELNEFLEYELAESIGVLPGILAVYLNALDLNDRSTAGPAERRAGQFLKTQIQSNYCPDVPIDAAELSWGHFPDYRRDIGQFSHDLSTTLLPPVLLDGADYWVSGSGVELLFAVYTNVAELDDLGRVCNHKHAIRRVHTLLTSEEIVLEQWETELH